MHMFLSVSAQVFSQSYGAEYVPVSLSTSVQSELRCICSCQSQHKCSVRVMVHMFLSVSAQVFSQSYGAEHELGLPPNSLQAFTTNVYSVLLQNMCLSSVILCHYKRSPPVFTRIMLQNMFLPSVLPQVLTLKLVLQNISLSSLDIYIYHQKCSHSELCCGMWACCFITSVHTYTCVAECGCFVAECGLVILSHHLCLHSE